MMRATAAFALGLVACLAMAPAAAAQAFELEPLEPARGAWRVDFAATQPQAGRQAFAAAYGVSDHVAIGGEAELGNTREARAVDAIALNALYRRGDAEAPWGGIGARIQFDIDRGGRVSGADLRAIGERRRHGWWLQGDLVLRRRREEGVVDAALGYAAEAQREFGAAWIGIEASGTLARLSRDPRAAASGDHYAGPSMTIESARGELGFALLARLDGAGPVTLPRVFLQFGF